MDEFNSLTAFLEDWFEKSLADIPQTNHPRILNEFPISWDDLNPEQRRAIAYQLDYQRDPQTKNLQQFWWDFFWRMEALEIQIRDWEKSKTPTALDKAHKEIRLAELGDELVKIKAQYKYLHSTYSPVNKPIRNTELLIPVSNIIYIPYLTTIKFLIEKFNSIPEELAAWIYQGDINGGLSAFLIDEKSNTLEKFYYDYYCGNPNYLAPLMTCKFKENDITDFQPIERYITGKMLIERWSTQSDITAVDYIRAKIEECRLIDLHPTMGVSQWNKNGSASVRGEEAIFALTMIQNIEIEDFDGVIAEKASVQFSPTESNLLHINGTQQNDSCDVFRRMPNLTACELTIIFVGDKDENGLGSNNMLEISARGETRRVSLAAIDLVDRRRGTLNSQGAILVGFVKNSNLTYNNTNSAKMVRLRKIFKRYFGIKKDPFYPYQKNVGWKPLFSILDNRGAADKRARQESMTKTYSYEENSHSNAQDCTEIEDSPYDSENDAAADWLNKH